MLNFEIHIIGNWDNILLSSVVMIHSMLYLLKTYNAQQESVMIELSWNTYDKYGDMPITLSTHNSQADTAAQEYATLSCCPGLCHPGAQVS
jgi:hypothetical protein